jgi:valyl-tRNA synthetase
LWPFATLGWPKKTKDLKRFYPTTVLSTARDILNLWVARMIFSGMEFMGKIPFKKVYIHPIVLTRTGERMSKSKGTGIDPLDLIEKYGADATRFGLAWQITGGQDIRFVEDNIIMGKKFCNKIWNASRFVLMQTKNLKVKKYTLKFNKKNLKRSEKRTMKALERTQKSVEKHLEDLRFGKATRALYTFFWHDFCDKCIEDTKKRIAKSESKKEKEEIINFLLYTLLTSLKLLHLFIPFITEEIYQKLPIKNKRACLMIEDWPK